MPMVFTLFRELKAAPTLTLRMRALATFFMWFAAGAFITSVVTAAIPGGPDGVVTDLIGGAVVAMVGGTIKAV